MALFPAECGMVFPGMWVDGGKHRADLYLQAWAAWPTQPHELHNFHGVNGFQHWEVPILAKLTGCSAPAFFLSPLTLVQSHSRGLGLSAKLWSPVLPHPKRRSAVRPILLLTAGVLHLDQWLGNEGHSETGQREKVSDSFLWCWENSTDECTLFSLTIQHKRENPTTEPPRVSSLSAGLCLRDDALTGTDVITNDL